MAHVLLVSGSSRKAGRSSGGSADGDEARDRDAGRVLRSPDNVRAHHAYHDQEIEEVRDLYIFNKDNNLTEVKISCEGLLNKNHKEHCFVEKMIFDDIVLVAFTN